ncbi:MAG: 50S ribosomal protein L19 [Candidatus Krumholzibacteria bacterium]|nr:50S ribosomal protein L19 [Candidatus Krumholzibacteria bacterium]
MIHRNVIDSLRYENLRQDLPEFAIGDTIRVAVRIREGGKERLQNFEGAVIAMQGTGQEKSLTVRKLSSGVAVERVFPLESPNLAAIHVVKRGRVRRAKLYYLRDKSGRQARIREARRK